MEGKNVETKPIIIAMKGHPGTGKSTLAHAIAKILKYPVIAKDHCYGCTKNIQQALMSVSPTEAHNLINDLSYDVMWHVASTQLGLGLGVIVDSPLSKPAYFNRLLDVACKNGAKVVIIECKPKNDAEWIRRIEQRAVNDSSSWHKPSSRREIERLLESYDGCWNYDVGDVPKLVLDTTAPTDTKELVSQALEFINARLFLS